MPAFDTTFFAHEHCENCGRRGCFEHGSYMLCGRCAMTSETILEILQLTDKEVFHANSSK